MKDELRHSHNGPVLGLLDPAPHFRPIRPPYRANSSSEACLTEPGALENAYISRFIGLVM